MAENDSEVTQELQWARRAFDAAETALENPAGSSAENALSAMAIALIGIGRALVAGVEQGR